MLLYGIVWYNYMIIVYYVLIVVCYNGKTLQRKQLDVQYSKVRGYFSCSSKAEKTFIPKSGDNGKVGRSFP